MSDDAGERDVDFQAKLEAIRLNRNMLNSCPRHSFGQFGVAYLGATLKCHRCGGEMDLVAISHYIRGYEAHGGNGNDILSAWKEPGENVKPKRSFFTPEA